MERWHFGRRRYVPHELFGECRRSAARSCSRTSSRTSAVPFLVGARRLGLPVVAHVASWDHTVGKGVIAPVLRLATSSRTTRCATTSSATTRSSRSASSSRAGRRPTSSTGAGRARSTRRSSARSASIRRARSCSSWGTRPTNTPVRGPVRRAPGRVVDERGAASRSSLLFRPHPRDREWRERFRARRSQTDGRRRAGGELHRLRDARDAAPALRLRRRRTRGRSCSTRSSTTGPAVCVLYDEGAPAGRELMRCKNVIGEHYRELAASSAFYRAGVVRGGRRPGSSARSRTPRSSPTSGAASPLRVVGEVDGHAGDARGRCHRLCRRVSASRGAIAERELRIPRRGAHISRRPGRGTRRSRHLAVVADLRRARPSRSRRRREIRRR